MIKAASGEFLRGMITGACLLVAGLVLQSAEFPPAIGDRSALITVHVPHAGDLTEEGRRRVEDALGTAAETFALVERDHVTAEIDEATTSIMMNGALKALDPHSGYLDAKAARRLLDSPETSSSRRLGIRVMDIEGDYVVESMLPGGPAETSGMMPGDQVVRVEDIYVDDDSPAEINRLIQDRIAALGDEERLEIGLLRKEGRGEISLSVLPQKVVLMGVDDLGVESGILHLHIRRFYEGMAKDVRSAISRAQSVESVTGVILDLRNDTGGLTREARDLADLFMPRDILLYEMSGRHIGVENVRTTTPPVFGDLDVAIIINKMSASASEIFAGGMQAHGRARIVGWPSFGKGTVQRIYPTTHGAIKITVAEYRDGGLRRIEGLGVTPDIVIDREDPAERPSRFVQDPAREAARRVLSGQEG